MLLLVAVVIGTTTAGCIIGTAEMFIHGVTHGPGNFAEDAGVYGYMLQVIFGLLMFAAVSPTALAEERQRGSLDVLMTTPLSTSTIVLGKWWGTFRFIPLLAFGPGIMAFAMAYGPSNGLGNAFIAHRHTEPEASHGVLLMVFTILSHGAFLTSLGLAMATWIPRLSRAMAISVTAYVLIAIAWPILYFVAIGGGPMNRNAFFPCFSPIYVAGTLADFLAMGASFDGFLWGATICDVIVSIAALALLAATIRTFERCLGRMPEYASPGEARPSMKEPVDEAELIGEWEAA